MEIELEKFKKFVESQINKKGEIPAFVGEWAVSFINENNAEDLVQYLIHIGGSALETFVELINGAPVTEVAWEKSVVVGPGVPDSEEKQAEYRAQRKRVVTMVRNTRAFRKYASSNA